MKIGLRKRIRYVGRLLAYVLFLAHRVQDFFLASKFQLTIQLFGEQPHPMKYGFLSLNLIQIGIESKHDTLFLLNTVTIWNQLLQVNWKILFTALGYKLFKCEGR